MSKKGGKDERRKQKEERRKVKMKKRRNEMKVNMLFIKWCANQDIKEILIIEMVS